MPSSDADPSKVLEQTEQNRLNLLRTDLSMIHTLNTRCKRSPAQPRAMRISVEFSGSVTRGKSKPPMRFKESWRIFARK